MCIYTNCIANLGNYTMYFFRILPEYEIDFVTSSVIRILNCDFSLPTDIIFQQHITGRRTYATKDYVKCLVKEPHVKQPVVCKPIISKMCPVLIDKQQPMLELCYRNLHNFGIDRMHIDTFKKYSDCMSAAVTRANTCLPKLTEGCLSANVTSLKTIRLSMQIAQNILQQDEDIKLVYLVRDPRGIINSRSHTNIISTIAAAQIHIEAKLLCSRLRDDLQLFETIQQRYKNRVLLVRYEDLTTNPLQFADVISRFGRNAALSEDVVKFVKEHISASTEDYSSFNTKRNNVTQLAYKWKTELSQSEISQINEQCVAVLKTLNYYI